MTTVVYGDILFILNAYVTDLLLLLCDALCHEKSRRGNRAAASLLGGLYAFVILIPHLPRTALVLSRLPMAAMLLFVTYGRVSRGRFFRLYVGFFLCNFVFAGLMGALYYTLHPRRMLYYGTVVYVSIDARTLVVLTAVCYAILWSADRLLSLRHARGCTYELTVSLGAKNVRCRAFLDTGNCLREPFSGDPVVLLSGAYAQTFGVPQEPDADQSAAICYRLIPCKTANGAGVLQAFRPTGLTVRAAEGTREIRDVFVALTDLPIKDGDFGALLPLALLEVPVKEHAKTKGGALR